MAVRTSLRMLLALTAVGASMLFAGNALAGNHMTVTVPQTVSSVPMGYCGPAFTSKAQMIAWYRGHPAQRFRAEAWVRAHAGYYHIQADQSFIAWLSMPNMKFRKAPAGYVLRGNTRCDTFGNVLAYNHKLAVGGVPMLWWCADAKGAGAGCTPVAKYYCRNWVLGRKVFNKPVHKPAPKPKPQPSPTQVAVCTLNGVPQYTQPPGYIINNQGQCVIQQQNCPANQVKDANGNCVQQANTAEQNCYQAATAYPGSTVNFNNNTNTCTITQVNANCSNVVVIIGGGSPTITQSGNCNNSGCSSNCTPAPQKPSFVFNTIEEIDASYVDAYGRLITSTRPMCGTASGAPGHVVTISFWSDYGASVAPSSISVTIPSSGTIGGICPVYTAGTHGGLTDHMHARPVDQTPVPNVAGDQADSNGFAVNNPKPAPPF